MSLAIVFPGQGSQTIGMLSDLANQYPVVHSSFEEASERLGMDLWDLAQNGPESDLNKTKNTQPVLLTVSVACWRLWLENNGSLPTYLAGHSLGEYSALVCGGSLEFTDAVALVADRGRSMQEAVPEGEGAMAAILGLDDEKVDAICKQLSSQHIVSAANFNSPGQVVIAGQIEAVNQAVIALKEAGAKRAKILSVSVPSHCVLMDRAAAELATRLEEVTFKNASIPIIQNVDATPRTDSKEIKHALIKQLSQPVLWSESVLKMKENGVKRIIECGPGKVLAGLCKRIDRELDAQAIFDVDSLQKAMTMEAI